MIRKATKKPVTIEFCRWSGENQREMYDFLGGDPNKYMEPYNDNFYISFSKVKGGLVIKTSEGDMVANIGDYIIKEPFDKDRKYYPCKPEIFLMTYDILEL